LKGFSRRLLSKTFAKRSLLFVKNRHSRGSGNPESVQLFENTGFPFSWE